MKLCNDTVTVFNARVDPDEGGNVWVPTVITGASWWATDASTVDASKGGLVAANKATIRIPVDADTGGKAYADPVSYANAEDVSGLWTLKGGDIVVKAAVEGEDWTPARLKKEYADCVVILGVTDNRRAPNASHWRITGT
ncbi:MAG: hypothetical protein IJI71_02760 [Clostridia bacterium]|nr:hypothetical protein [Clostridia bacterium]